MRIWTFGNTRFQPGDSYIPASTASWRTRQGERVARIMHGRSSRQRTRSSGAFDGDAGIDVPLRGTEPIHDRLCKSPVFPGEFPFVAMPGVTRSAGIAVSVH
ncbi:MAG: hypothetical protein AVDCRST_MAG87-3248 [uncultured Thermomicrobiales bacterium]|uniref:Uncharacterized protein n=1 Tax=uncultured Thermomicrobiales bacterium TaxID=1645740 RepID=A0A6J4VJD9_9BACT|nr:MAG: hypothetical protein AVDCRST_MAG87-3248 [uncultured Thermomicrobiales bacterium]